MEYNTIAVETRGKTGIITLNRPQAMNSANEEMLKEIAEQVKEFEKNTDIGAIIIRGSDKVFAAGIDIKELVEYTTQNNHNIENMGRYLENIANAGKPTIAAVAGYALGIGCELALACDIILCADNARFGQPETSLGMIPGFGGTQRLTKAAGKAKTMEAILSGRAITAEEAEKCGIASRIIALPDLFEESIRVADKIAAQPPLAVKLARQAIKSAAANLNMADGIAYEKACADICLNSAEFRERLRNFAEKRS